MPRQYPRHAAPQGPWMAIAHGAATAHVIVVPTSLAVDLAIAAHGITMATPPRQPSWNFPGRAPLHRSWQAPRLYPRQAPQLYPSPTAMFHGNVHGSVHGNVHGSVHGNIDGKPWKCHPQEPPATQPARNLIPPTRCRQIRIPLQEPPEAHPVP